MRDVVRKAFFDFNLPMEGGVDFLYQDVKGLVSIGVGILADPIDLALALPLVHRNGALASRLDIAAEWQIVKGLPPDAKGRTAAQLGHTYAKQFTSLRLTIDGLRSTLERKLDSDAVVLRGHYPEIEEWPADAQLAIHSLAWACGPHLPHGWPRLTAALRALDFRTAAVECFMPEEATISGLRPRNRANRILFTNAAIALHTLDPDVLFWPADLEVQRPETKTQPSIVDGDPPELAAAIIHPLPGRELDPNE